MKGKYTDEFIASREFLNTYEWRKVRMEALVKHGNKCMCCNRTPEGEYYTCVDHIKPRKTHPHLAIDIDNLQILCNVCNHGKGNWDSTDWREGNELVFTITKEWIDNNRASGKSFTKAQVEALGLKFSTLPRGWVKSLIGRKITLETKTLFEQGAFVTLPRQEFVGSTKPKKKKVRIKKKSKVELRILKLEEELRKAKEAANK